MIEVRNLLKVFDTRGQVVRAVDDVSTRVARGERRLAGMALGRLYRRKSD
ncbi:hypothetical protein ACLBWA_35160, partial [Pseudomonas aeruginosa]